MAESGPEERLLTAGQAALQPRRGVFRARGLAVGRGAGEKRV